MRTQAGRTASWPGAESTEAQKARLGEHLRVRRLTGNGRAGRHQEVSRTVQQGTLALCQSTGSTRLRMGDSTGGRSMCKSSSEPFTLHHSQGLISHSPLEPSGDVPGDVPLSRTALLRGQQRTSAWCLQKPSQRAARPPEVAQRGAGEQRWRA